MIDFTGYRHCLQLFLIWGLLLNTTKGHIDRDIILSPNKTQQQIGKILYFSPKEVVAGALKDAAAIDSSTTDEKQAMTTVPWEEPLKHAIYLVLNNKVNGNLNASDTIKRDVFYKAKYLRDGDEDNQPKFGDIISLARGRLVQHKNGELFLVEIPQHYCDKTNCSIDDEIGKNVTAFWMVEKIRHRDPSRGYANELKITIFPIKKTRSDSKREIAGLANNQQLTTRSFVVRDKDYPKYFSEDTAVNNYRIQKRTFDMFAGLTKPSFDNYRLPLHFNYKKPHPKDLNTGEYFIRGHEKVAGTAATAFYHPPPFSASQYSPTAFHAPSHHVYRPNHIRFPTASDIIDKSTEYLDPVSSTPFTATHLHHHFYLNKHNVPLIKATGYEKENIYENSNSPSTTENNYPGIQNQLPHNVYVDSSIPPTAEQLQQNYSVDGYGTPNNIGFPVYTEQPRLHDPSEQFQSDHQIYQTPFALPDQVPSPPSSNNNQIYHQSQYPYAPHLQLISPPHQQYFNQQDIPLTTAPYVGLVPQFHQNQLFSPIVDLHPRHNNNNHQSSIVSGTDRPPIQFQGNIKYDLGKYSDPDPIYHQQITLMQQHLNPHLMSHLLPGYYEHTQLVPNNNFQTNQETTPYPPQQQHILSTTQGSYAIPPRKPSLPSETEPDQISQHDEVIIDLPDKDNVEIGELKDNQTKYPDSINAQLPPPEQGDDLTVPYVDSSVVVHTSKIVEGTRNENNQNKIESHVKIPVKEKNESSKTSRSKFQKTEPEDSQQHTDELAHQELYRLPMKQQQKANRTDQEQNDREEMQHQPQQVRLDQQRVEQQQHKEQQQEQQQQEQQHQQHKEQQQEQQHQQHQQHKKQHQEQHQEQQQEQVDPQQLQQQQNHEQESENNMRPSLQSQSTQKAQPLTTILMPVLTTEKSKRPRQRGYLQQKATTEKPILKWMPKRTKPKSMDDQYAQSNDQSATSATPDIITVTPIRDSDEPQTSISTSISIKVGSDEDTSSPKSNVNPTGTTSVYRGFLPTILPSNLVQLTKSNITSINTNSSELVLFKASEQSNPTDRNDVEEDHHIERSIINHFQNLY